MWEVFIQYNLYPTYIFELIAVLAGFYYYFRDPNINKSDRFFIFTLLLVFIADAFTITYALYGYVYHFKYVEFINGTPFTSHLWLANSWGLIMYSAYVFYLAWNIRSLFWKRTLYYLIGVFIMSSIISFFLVDGFFTETSVFARFFGAFLISTGAAVYLIECISSDRILSLRSDLTFYVAWGLLIFYLSLTPLLLMQKHVSRNDALREVFTIILSILNFITYGIYVTGFLMKSHQAKKTKAAIKNNS